MDIGPAFEILITTRTRVVSDVNIISRAILSDLAWFLGTTDVKCNNSLVEIPLNILDLNSRESLLTTKFQRILDTLEKLSDSLGD